MTYAWKPFTFYDHISFTELLCGTHMEAIQFHKTITISILIIDLKS